MSCFFCFYWIDKWTNKLKSLSDQTWAAEAFNPFSGNRKEKTHLGEIFEQPHVAQLQGQKGCKYWLKGKCSNAVRRVKQQQQRADDALTLTRYLQTKSLTNTARRMLPTIRKILKASKSSTSGPPSCAGFSLANWPRSFMASSKRDRYFCRPGRGELLRSSDRRSPLGLCLRPPMSSSREPPRCSPRLGSGEPLLSGVALCERLPCSETSE